MQKQLKSLFKFGFGILILGMLFYKVGFQEIVYTLKTVNLFWIILSIPITISTFMIGACKIILLLKRQGYDIPFSKMFRYSFLGWAFGTITPGKIGEFSLVYFLRNEGVMIGRGAAIIILDRFITISTYSLIAIFGIGYFLPFNDFIKVSIILILCLGAVSFAVVSERSRNFIKNFILRKYAKKFRNFSKTFFYFLKEERSILCLNAGISLARHVVNACLPFIYFLALDTYVPYTQIFWITGILISLSIVPLTVSGLGIQETAAVFLYGSIANVPAPIVVSSCVLGLITRYSIGAFGSMVLLGRRKT